MIKFAGGDVGFDLLIPGVGHKILKPSGKGSQVRLRQMRNS
jgi:hypothetical protein